MAKITINGISIDPQAEASMLATANLTKMDSSASNFILVQTKQPLNQAQQNEMARLGATVLEYVPENTYICRFPSSDLSTIRALPFVSWANVYMQGFKVAASLRPGPAAVGTANLLTLTAPDTLSKDPVTVDVVLHKHVAAESVRDKVASAAGLNPTMLNVSRNKIRLTTQRSRLKDLAAIDEVRNIEPYIAPRLFNNIARGILKADDVQSGGSLEGDGQVIAVADTGFDKGLTNDVHPAFTGRVIKLYALGRPGDASDPDGHGTHVAGSVLGDGVMQDGTVVRGTAPKAQLIFQSVLDSGGRLGGLPTDLHDLFAPTYQDDGVRIHSNSWGSPASGAYTSSSSEVDDFVWNHRDFVICFAAGNDGRDSQGRGVIDSGSVGSPATAKNCITVGACENNRPNFPLPGSPSQSLLYGNGWPQDFPANPIHPDPVANEPSGMAAFSSRGPTTNGRVRPDVLAPGTAVLSTRSRVATGTGWGPSSDPLFFFDGGTSMATPLVAGCAAVVRQYLQSKGVANPSAALVKAILINGAGIIPGQYVPSEVGPPPDTSQGFGRADLLSTVNPAAQSQSIVFYDENTALDTGQAQTVYTGPVAKMAKVTLVWSDPAGEALQNDLDLVLQNSAGQEWHGNVAAGSSAFDRTNNVEQVIWQPPSPDSFTVAVRCFRAVTPQTYALVVRFQT
jgi:serine protease AprX